MAKLFEEDAVQTEEKNSGVPESSSQDLSSIPASPKGSGKSSGSNAAILEQIKQLLIEAAKPGMSAVAVTIALGQIEAGAPVNTPEAREATRRVRGWLRNVVDSTPGGSRNTTDGRSKIYKIYIDEGSE